METSKLAFRLTPVADAIEAELEERPLDLCTICNENIGRPRLDDRVETAVMLPCSHVFGSVCIARWLETDSLHKDCPNCRRQMVYKGCGHPVKSCEVERTPKPVSEKDMPEKCVVCRGGGDLEERLRWMRKRQEAEEGALVSMSISLPGIFGDYCRTSVHQVDARIKESRETWKREMEALIVEIQEKYREVW